MFRFLLATRESTWRRQTSVWGKCRTWSGLHWSSCRWRQWNIFSLWALNYFLPLQARDRDKILALLLSRVRPSKSEFSVDEGYLTTSSTGSEQPAKCSYFTPWDSEIFSRFELPIISSLRSNQSKWREEEEQLWAPAEGGHSSQWSFYDANIKYKFIVPVLGLVSEVAFNISIFIFIFQLGKFTMKGFSIQTSAAECWEHPRWSPCQFPTNSSW